jgi:siroheme synthase-like protein
MIDIEDKNCLVAGGGKIALHKVKILLQFDVNIKVVAPVVCKELEALVNENTRLFLEIRAFQDNDIKNADMVVAATDSLQLNNHISEICRKNSIPVNAVDMKAASTFIFPAILKEEDVLVAVSTGGESPAGAAYIKRNIKKNMPDYYGEMISSMGLIREIVMERVDSSEKRKELFEKLLEYGDSHQGSIPRDYVYKLIDEV